jgi:hypothetical protein
LKQRHYRAPPVHDGPFRLSLDCLQAGEFGFGGDNLTSDHLKVIAAELGHCLDRTWDQVVGVAGADGGAGAHGYRPFESQCDQLKGLVNQLEFDEDRMEVVRGRLFRFRVDDQARVWGYVHEGVFYPLWWDPEHKLNDRTSRNRDR